MPKWIFQKTSTDQQWVCGDLSDWVPLDATIHITYENLDKQE